MVLRDRIGAPEATVRTADHEACLGDWWSAETGMLYSLIDEAGAIKVKVCNSELSSSLLKPARGGKSVCAEMVVSQLAFDLSGVEKDGRLTIDFASTSAAYEPVTRYAKTDLAFADKVVGHYHSADAGAQATIQRLGCHLEIVLSDGFGVFRVMLRQLAEGLVCMETSPPADQPHAVLNFAFCDEGASGFILNSIRTRNLAFHRVESAPDGGLAGR